MNTAFITGASSGFGWAIAKALHKKGYAIVGLSRRGDRLEALADELKDRVYMISCDVRNKLAVFDAVESLPDKFKNISVLVNNAGLALGQESFKDADIMDFEAMIDTNIKGLIYTTKAVLPLMLARKSGGYIFNLGSVAGRYPYAGSNVYGGTKAFVRQFSLNLRTDLAGTGIRVTNIAPGIAKTEFSEVRFKGDKARADAVYEGTKYLVADDIARLVSDCLNLPEHININELEVMSTTQTWAGFAIERE